MNKSSSAGGSIEAWCPRCNLNSAHTITAVVNKLPDKIKCNTCDEHHNLSDKPSVKTRMKPKTKSPARKSKSKEITYQDYLSRLTGDPANSIKYNIKGNFKKDEFVDHLNFGVGIVLSVIQINKIKILFKDGPRLLIQNQ